jgi:hypothetical protein
MRCGDPVSPAAACAPLPPLLSELGEQMGDGRWLTPRAADPSPPAGPLPSPRAGVSASKLLDSCDPTSLCGGLPESVSNEGELAVERCVASAPPPPPTATVARWRDTGRGGV